MTSINVLFVADRAVAGTGPHRNVVGSLNALAMREDVHVRLLTGEVDRSEVYAQDERVELFLGFRPHQPASALNNLRLLSRAQSGMDVIYVPTGLKSLLWAQLARRPGRPLVSGPNVTPLPNRLQDSPGWIEFNLLSSCWVECSISRRDHVVRSTANTEVRVVHHAIDHSRFSPSRRTMETRLGLNLPVDVPLLIFVGRDNVPLKGVSQLLEAFALVQRSRAVALCLVGEMSSETLSTCAEFKDVYPLGFHSGDQLADLYAAADIAVVPSSWENFPFTVLEAMSSGLPVVAGNVGGIPEMIIPGDTGVLVDLAVDGKHSPDAPSLLAAAILELIDSPVERKRLGQNARQRVLDHFTEERLGRDLVGLFSEMITG